MHIRILINIVCILYFTIHAIYAKEMPKVHPITGTWINLAYQDERNKYTNPKNMDNTDPQFWEEKVNELSRMGIEYLIFMAVANEGKSFYPSNIMPWAYSKNKTSPVEAIMSTASRIGMKVFMSIGWAKDQDDDLRNPVIKQRQLDIMKELAALYGSYKSFYGWYLPVEDCICPILAEHAVIAVNDLANRARSYLPGKKIMISPYGLVNSDFEHPAYERQLKKLKVDIIAYQDEVGCVREHFPLSNLGNNLRKLKKIHNKLNIDFWINSESFTWEKGTNSRSSALIPGAFPRLLSQLCIASKAGVEKAISFVMCGLYESPKSKYKLGQPVWSNQVYSDYMDWQSGKGRWNYLEASFMDRLRNINNQWTINESVQLQKLIDNQTASEDPNNECWIAFDRGYHEITIDLKDVKRVNELFVRMLNYAPENIRFPQKVYLWGSKDGVDFDLLSIRNSSYFPNDLHDAWIDGIWFEKLDKNIRFIKIAFNA